MKLLAGACLLALTLPVPTARDVLPSWAEGPSRDALVEFVAEVTAEGTAGFVPPAERIAVFDNDGTLWCERPYYFQLAFALDRVKELAPGHPEWKDVEPFKSALAGDVEGVKQAGMEGLMKLVMASHAGLTSDEFADVARRWLGTARHPESGKLYREMVYRPMLELLDYLRANGFKTFIVSGGGIDFLRVFAEEVYGIPPEQVVGTAIEASYELRGGTPVIVKEAKLDFLDDGPGKPVGIHRHIGRRPILAGGNSDGDREMLEYTTVGNPRPSLALIVHHTDAEREYAYDRESHVGRLDKALDQAAERGWVLVDVKRDWKRVFAGE